MVEVLDDGGNAMANAMQSSDIAKDIKRVMVNILLGFRYFYDKKLMIAMSYSFYILVHSILSN